MQQVQLLFDPLYRACMTIDDKIRQLITSIKERLNKLLGIQLKGQNARKVFEVIKKIHTVYSANQDNIEGIK